MRLQTQGEQRLIDLIRPGDRVTIRVSNGIGRNGIEWKEKTGTAVIVSPGHVALNMGGRYGTPGVATEKNLVAVRPARARAPRHTCDIPGNDPARCEACK
jgi:hypothetical protein